MMTKFKSCQTFEQLQNKIKNYITDEEDLELIKKAYEYASSKHFGEKRLTGEDYITHPLSVAYILTGINADATTIAAALLHDVFYVGDAKEKEVKELFGEDILSIIKGVTKINKLKLSGDSESIIKNQRKILVGLSEDVRVIIIKLADRLHNMKTIYALDEKKQKQTSKETLDVLAPIAHRLGMNHMKQELEELSLRYLKPNEYYDIVEKLNATKTERDQSVAKMCENVSELLNKHGIKHEIKGRSKSIYSIFKKLDKGKRFSDIYDLLALRVFVNTEEECYQTLGIIHSKYKPKPNRFKDYIAMPKTNMYQSLHTTVFGFDGQLYEIQIRTYEMDKIAENGIASHWSYKEKGSDKLAMQNDMEQKLQFFKSIMELKRDNPESFEVSLDDDVLKTTIYVFTPMGDVIELPPGATPIDFAYRVHTKVGDHMTGAIVNNKMVPLNHVLENNDVVKIITNNNKGPSREWLEIAKTSQAKSKIKNHFNKIDKDENIKLGEEILAKELKKRRLALSNFDDDVLEKLKYSSLNELYSNLGSGKATVDIIFDNLTREDVSKEEVLLSKTSAKDNFTKQGIISVKGINDIKVNIAGCCMPVPGDKIAGFITKGNGITIHRINCPNIANTDERLIEVKWNKTENKFSSTLMIYASLNSDLLLKIVSKASNKNIGIQNITNIKSFSGGTIELTILVKDKEELTKFINDIKGIEEVKEVERLVR